MALFTRLTRMFRADMHEVLDRLEEPDLLLRQAIRDMEDSLAQRTRHAGLQAQEREALQVRQEEINSHLQRIENELDLCFQAGNEALTRTLIRRKLETEKCSQNLAQTLIRLNAQIQRDNVHIEEQKQRLEVMKQKAATFLRQPSPDENGNSLADYHTGITDTDVDIALLREQQKRSPT